MDNIDVAVIGGGPAGLAAAIEAKKQGAENVLVIERDAEMGGILQQCIHSGFGLHIFGEELTGPEYAWRFIQQAEDLGIKFMLDTMVLEIEQDKTITAVNSSDGLFKLRPKAVVLGMGCRERSRGALNIPGTRPAGIFTAGTAQKFVNINGYLPGKKVVILGSGDIGLIMARRMTLEGAEVKMVCEILPYSGGLMRNIVQCLEDFNIPLKLKYTVAQIHGKERLEGVTVAEVDENLKPKPETFQYVECDTLLLSVGLIPENELSREAGIKIDPVTSGPIVNESMETSASGIFACGNVVHVHDLVDYVTEESRLAGRCAAIYANRGDNAGKSIESIKTSAGSGIRYVVPHFIRREFVQKESKLFFRTADVYRNVEIVVKAGEEVVFSVRKTKVSPGEMESIRVADKLLDKIGDSRDITVEIRKTKA